MGKTPLGKPAQVQNFSPDVTEVRPVVRFRRFCHRAPHREQTADGHTAIRPFTVITPQWLQGTISQGRFYILKIPKKSPSKEVYLLKMLCFFAPLLAFVVFWRENPEAAPAGSRWRSASSSQPSCFLHKLPVTLKVKKKYVISTLFVKKKKKKAFMTTVKRKITAINSMTNFNQTSLVYSSFLTFPIILSSISSILCLSKNSANILSQKLNWVRPG